MKLLYLTIPILILASCVLIWAASEEQAKANSAEFSSSSGFSTSTKRQGVRLISFDTVDKDINLGLNYLLPFVEVPMTRKRNAPPRPLLIVNSAAIFSCGLVAAGGVLVGHLIRSMGLETILPDGKSEKDSVKHTARGLLDEEQSVLQLLDNFKLIYRNASGERVETRLPSLINTIESTFLENDINLPICLLKSICALIHRANQNVRNGAASELEQLLAGATSWSWLLSWLEQSALREAIEAGRTTELNFCTAKYHHCKWTAPDIQLLELLLKNVQFN